MEYDYKIIECSICHITKECRMVWSNVIPWVCESCCEHEGMYWTKRQEDEDNE